MEEFAPIVIFTKKKKFFVDFLIIYDKLNVCDYGEVVVSRRFEHLPVFLCILDAVLDRSPFYGSHCNRADAVFLWLQ